MFGEHGENEERGEYDGKDGKQQPDDLKRSFFDKKKSQFMT